MEKTKELVWERMRFCKNFKTVTPEQKKEFKMALANWKKLQHFISEGKVKESLEELINKTIIPMLRFHERSLDDFKMGSICSSNHEQVKSSYARLTKLYSDIVRELYECLGELFMEYYFKK